jgi:hypothetical protein
MERASKRELKLPAACMLLLRIDSIFYDSNYSAASRLLGEVNFEKLIKAGDVNKVYFRIRKICPLRDYTNCAPINAASCGGCMQHSDLGRRKGYIERGLFVIA